MQEFKFQEGYFDLLFYGIGFYFRIIRVSLFTAQHIYPGNYLKEIYGFK